MTALDRVLKLAGMPAPVPLARDASPALEDRRIAASDTLRPALSALGAKLADAGEVDGVAFDARAFREPADLDELYERLRALAPRLARCGKLLVLAPAPASEPARAATARAIEGFVRALAKELGRRGATANVLYVDEAARDDRLAAPLRFFLSARSAYVSGQALRVTSLVAPAPPARARRAIVTGAARGLGEAIARRLAADGDTRVVCVDVPSAKEALDALAREIGGEAVSVDITTPDAATVLSAPDVLVHNAGVTRDRTLKNMTRAEWDAVLAVNLRAILRLDEALLPPMRAGGRVAYVSSVNGIAGAAGQTNYSATKAALLGYVAAQAPRLAPRGITANAVAPGFIRTRMTDAMPFVMREISVRMNSLSQAGEPRDVAEAIAFLASPDAHGVTGQTLRVCGQALVGA